ncbi:NlpC/P60 family protein [Paenibacillus psychroresistens]|uniref:NlpC/P60 family protein n=1 Tax=Paenibacillus psychroresistens TaxID=1778678 RepID=A0A6B8RQI9_9BACL|nr:C40 family peptidase [Paenibacillus psychroresistens]QGQ98651.1 NlpC/P60 family protein [Paenibacillus psychroresistens]
MYTSIKKHWAKSIVAVSLSLSMMVSGSMFFTAKPAYADTTISSSKASNIIATGKRFIGVKYKFGADSGSSKRFDCSSLMQYIFDKSGIDLPRSSHDQSRVGTYVSRNNLKPGDLVFFYSPVHHVAVYIGNGKILHTWGDPGVTISDINSGWWGHNYTTARRVIR